MSNYTKVKNIMLYVLNNAEYLSFMNHVLDLANGMFYPFSYFSFLLLPAG